MKKELNVMIVDDCYEDRRAYHRYLSREANYHYHIFEAEYGEDALAKYASIKPELILLDYSLPDCNGLEFIEHLRSQTDDLPPIIMLSGQGNETVAVKAIQSGAYDYCVKDYVTAETLNKTIENVLEKYRLNISLGKNKRQQQLIKDVALLILQSSNLQNLFKTTVTEVHKLLKCDRVLLCRFNVDLSGKIVAESVKSGWRKFLGTKIDNSYFLQCGDRDRHRQGEILTFDDIETSYFSEHYLDLLAQFQVKASAMAPILLHSPDSESNSWGLLIAHHCHNPHQWQQDEIEVLEKLSLHLSIAIQQAELLKSLTDELAWRKQAEARIRRAKRQILRANSLLEQRVHTHLSLRKLNQRLAKDAARQKLLLESSDRIRRSLDLESILQTATQEIRALLDCDLVWIACLGKNKISIEAFSQSDFLGFALPETIPQTFFYDNSAQYQSYLQGNVRIIANNDCNITSDRFKLCISQNGAIAPILIDRENDNTLWGWLVANRCQSLQPWSGEEIDLLQKVTLQLAIAIKQGLLYQQISRLALLDPLTQIYNRRYFQRQLHLEWRRLKRLAASLSLIMCNVDYFKAYNDTYGHQQGDRCLQNIAQAISKVIKRSGDFVARYGGEEFVVILPHTSESGAMKVAEKMRIAVRALEIPHLNSQVDSVVTVSMGVAHTIPNERDSINGLIETADRALYEAKKRGRDCVSVYSGNFLHLQSQLMREIH